MKILITGGLGFIGSNAALYLQSKGHDVEVLDKIHTAREPFLRDAGVKITIADLNYYEPTIKAVEGKDVIIHLAAQVSHLASMQNPHIDLDDNGHAFINVLEAMRWYNKDAKFIYSSSRSVYGVQQDQPIKETATPAPIDFYGATKLLGEHYTRIYGRTYGIDYTIFRQANVYGPMQRVCDREYQVIAWFFRNVMLNETIRFWGGKPSERVRDFIYVGDLIRAYERAFEDSALKQQIFNIQGDVKTWQEAFETMFSVFNRTVPIEHDEYPDLEAEKLDNHVSTLDGTKLAQYGMRLPVTGLQDGLLEMKAWYESHDYSGFLR